MIISSLFYQMDSIVWENAGGFGGIELKANGVVN